MKQSEIIRLSCRVDVPQRFVPAARYALEALLMPLRIEPTWVSDVAQLHYGPRGSGSLISLDYSESAWSYFGSGEAYQIGRTFRTGGVPVLFGSPDEPDLVASTFFLLSGWDEFTERPRDEHARFRADDSVLGRLHALTTPPVDRYRELLGRQLEQAGVSASDRTWGDRTWAFLPTFDIDYLREWRPGTILTRGLKRPLALLRGVMTGTDAYLDGFHELLSTLAGYGVSGTFFFKAGDRSPYDPAYRRSDTQLSRLLAMVHESGSEVGLHPGYFAATHEDYLDDEVRRIARWGGRRPRIVRQHYLRYELPRTSRLHESAGFRIDSTLGFADHEGFRRGTTLPFRIFDPAEMRALDVWEISLSFMDATMVARRGQTAEQSLETLHTLMEEARSMRGACVALWHNTLWDPSMDGWPQMLRSALDDAVGLGAYVGGLDDAFVRWSGVPRRVE